MAGVNQIRYLFYRIDHSSSCERSLDETRRSVAQLQASAEATQQGGSRDDGDGVSGGGDAGSQDGRVERPGSRGHTQSAQQIVLASGGHHSNLSHVGAVLQVIAGIAGQLLRFGRADMACWVLISHGAYLRPVSNMRMRQRCLVPPVRDASSHWCILLNSSDYNL